MADTIDPDVALAHGLAHRLALSFAVLVADQLLTSESDRPYEPFVAAFPADRRVTATSVRDELGFDPSRAVRLAPGAAFFEQVVAAAVDAGDRGGEQAYLVLQRVMSRTLGTLHHAFVRGAGVVEVPFLLFGRLAGGPLVGLRSTAIET